MEFFKKNKIIVLRSIGGLMLFISFILYFWDAPQKKLTQNERAAANIARMEAKVSSATTSRTKNEGSKFLQNLKETQDKQLRYMLIFFMIFGLGFLGYSFIKRD